MFSQILADSQKITVYPREDKLFLVMKRGPLLVKRAAERHQAEVPGPVTDLLKNGRSAFESWRRMPQ